ncbi:restriction endonuclease subunit S [Clostridium cadaveris]|uniref:restriction endonuclease subunit S n=1 Tax=Clostridium cadaveris TaxID=1529 RepID=UPI0039A07ED4
MSCNEWKTVKLGDVADVLSGYAFKTKDFIEEGVPVVKIKNIIPPNIDINDTQYVSNEMYEEKIKYALNYNDILISMTGSNVNQIASAVGKIGRVKLKYTKLLLNQRVGKLFVKDNSKCNYDYLYYYLIQPEIRYNLAANAGGSANQANISPADIKNIDIKLPSLEEQEKIVNILSCLDDKIELNNEMNKTLEEMAQSIFKRWFVDFEFPNEDGQPYKSSGGEMVESELGMIPEGWEIKTIGDIGNIITGKTPSSKIGGCFGNEYNFITPRDIDSSIFILKTERELSSIGVDKLKRNIVPKNSVGVSCIGSNLGEVYITGEDSITNQQINTVVLNREELYPYVYIYLKNMKEDFLNMSSGSAVPIINKTSFSNINILIPNIDLLNKYVKAISCYFDRIKENIKEIESLTILRDTLLPKLINGEIIK